MNKTIKSVFALTLAVLMLLAVCVGCAKDGSEGASSISSDSSAVEESVGVSSGVLSENSVDSNEDNKNGDSQSSSHHSEEGSNEDSVYISDTESAVDSTADSNAESNTESNVESDTESSVESNTESDTFPDPSENNSEAESVPEDNSSSEDSSIQMPSEPDVDTDADNNTVISVTATDYYEGDATGKLTITAPVEVTAGEKFTVSFKWTDYVFDTGYVGAFTFAFSLDTRYVTLARGNVSDVEIVGKTLEWIDVSNYGNASKESKDKSKANYEPVSLSMAIIEKDEGTKNSFTAKVEFVAVYEGNCAFQWADYGVEFGDLFCQEILTHSMDGCDFTVKVVAKEGTDPSSSQEAVSEEPSSEEESVAALPEYIDGKRVYGIKTFESLGAISWDSVEKAEIDTYKWVQSVEYEAYAQLVFVKDYGFVCRMTCMESEPLANYTQFGDPVYLDSCMEFFAKWDNKSYINIESNSKGALCCQFGAVKAGRKPATDYLPLNQMFDTNPVVEDGKWTLTMEIPIAKLQKFYGNSLTADTFTSGYQFTGNFYKIGSDAVTGVRHYGMWNEVNGSSPDFHRPEDFGIFIMV